MNLTDKLQQDFNYAPLQKIDANTQDVTDKDNHTAGAFEQAAIPVVLIGLYKFTRSDAGAESIIRGEISSNWVQTIFTGHYQDIIKRVADYANNNYEETEKKLNAISGKAVELIKDAVSPDYKIMDVKEFMGNQRNNILPYLPGVLQTGELMDDTTLDDRTNKMEGPISSLMHAIGSGFSGSDKSDK
jgi:hypothetical protein